MSTDPLSIDVYVAPMRRYTLWISARAEVARAGVNHHYRTTAVPLPHRRPTGGTRLGLRPRWS